MVVAKIEDAVQSINNATEGWRPRVGVVLGSGFAGWVDTLDVQHRIPYRDIPGFPTTTVKGHEGTLISAMVGEVPVLVMQGRFHYYEGHTMADLSIPVRVFRDLGIETVYLTNAAGGINEHFEAGELMIIEDHLNLVGSNPLIGPNQDQYGLRFPDAAAIYTPSLKQLARETADEIDLAIRSGVYAFTTGPSFETPAEIRMMRTLGADAVGMSTVPEALVANHANMKVFGLSLIANLASGMSPVELTHEEVLATMEKVSLQANRFITLMISRLQS